MEFICADVPETVTYTSRRRTPFAVCWSLSYGALLTAIQVSWHYLDVAIARFPLLVRASLLPAQCIPQRSL